MFNSETTALLRSVLDEVCAGISIHETATKALVASKILESASKGELDADSLRSVGRRALRTAPPCGISQRTLKALKEAEG
jgi:hypothetical protein